MYNVLIIGAGDIGSEYDNPKSESYLTHAHAFVDHSEFHLVGFVDPNQKAAEKAALKWNVISFQTIEEAYSKNNIDIVTIAAPDEVHYSILKELIIYKPKFVLAEKPLTLTLEEAKEVKELYDEIPVIVNFRRRFVPEIIALKESISKDKLGKFVFGTSYYGKGFYHNGSHLINLLFYLLDSDWDGFEIINTISDYKDEDPSLSVLLKDNNQNASFLIKALDHNDFTIFEFDLFFEKGRVRITDLSFEIEEYSVKKNKFFPDFRSLEKERVYRVSLEKSLMLTVDHIYNYLNKGAELLCTVDEVYSEMKFMNRIIKEV